MAANLSGATCADYPHLPVLSVPAARLQDASALTGDAFTHAHATLEPRYLGETHYCAGRLTARKPTPEPATEPVPFPLKPGWKVVAGIFCATHRLPVCAHALLPSGRYACLSGHFVGSEVAP